MKIGISFPYRSNGKGSVMYSDGLIQSIEDNLKQIIYTKKGERRMNPEFGCDIWKVLFEYDEYIIDEMVREYVKQAIEIWELRIDIIDIITSKKDEFINIELIYTIKNSNMPIKNINMQYFLN